MPRKMPEEMPKEWWNLHHLNGFRSPDFVFDSFAALIDEVIPLLREAADAVRDLPGQRYVTRVDEEWAPRVRLPTVLHDEHVRDVLSYAAFAGIQAEHVIEMGKRLAAMAASDPTAYAKIAADEAKYIDERPANSRRDQLIDDGLGNADGAATDAESAE